MAIKKTPSKGLPQEIVIKISMKDYMEGTLEDHIKEGIISRLVHSIDVEYRRAIVDEFKVHLTNSFDVVAKEEMKKFFETLVPKNVPQNNLTDANTPQTYTFYDHFASHFKTYMQQRVDPVSGNLSGYNNAVPRTDWLLKQVGERPLQTAINEEVKRVSDMAQNQMKSLISGYISQQLMPTINVPAIQQLPKG